MSSPQRPLLEGHPSADDSVRLRREIAGLEHELQEAKNEAVKYKQASSDSIQAIRALREALDPFHKALKMIFGEMSRVDAGKTEVTAEGARTANSKLEMMKERLGGRQAEFIELLEHGEMTTAQLAAAGHCHHQTVATIIMKLNRAGLIQKNGNKFSLKET